MNKHLGDSEIAQMIAGGRIPVGSHAEHCTQCRLEIDNIEKRFRNLGEWSKSASDMPEEFWAAQRMRTVRSLKTATDPARLMFPRIAWPAFVGLVVLATVMLASTPSLPTEETQAATDHDLLVQVERALESGGPAALAPTSILLQEISGNTASSLDSRDQTREINHEN